MNEPTKEQIEAAMKRGVTTPRRVAADYLTVCVALRARDAEVERLKAENATLMQERNQFMAELSRRAFAEGKTKDADEILRALAEPRQ